jgi:hypothetical protein
MEVGLPEKVDAPPIIIPREDTLEMLTNMGYPEAIAIQALNETMDDLYGDNIDKAMNWLLEQQQQLEEQSRAPGGPPQAPGGPSRAPGAPSRVPGAPPGPAPPPPGENWKAKRLETSTGVSQGLEGTAMGIKSGSSTSGSSTRVEPQTGTVDVMAEMKARLLERQNKENISPGNSAKAVPKRTKQPDENKSPLERALEDTLMGRRNKLTGKDGDDDDDDEEDGNSSDEDWGADGGAMKKYKRKVTKRKVTKRKVTKRKVSKRKVSKRKVSKRKVSKRKVSKRKVSKRKVSKRRF